MCKAPKPPPAPEAPKPKYLVNPVLDAAESSTISQLRVGRSALRTDLRITPGQAPAAPSVAATRERLTREARQDRARELVNGIAGSAGGLSIGIGGI